MKEIIDRFKDKRILVIGDLILDHYIQGAVSRISQEAPVPIVHQQGNERFTPGGAANVANNLTSLGAKVTIGGQIGTDQEGRKLLSELKRKRIDVKAVFKNSKLPTSLKTRVIAQHQQVLRIDREIIDFKASEDIVLKLINFVENNISQFDAIIISDYGKGVVTSKLVRSVSLVARKKKKIITVDPKEDHFEYYKYVTAITPNRAEAQNAVRNIALKNQDFKVKTDKLVDEASYQLLGFKLLNFLKLECLLLTLGEDGMRLFEKESSKPHIIKTQAIEVFDVSGAGDTVISVFTLSLACGASFKKAADLSNIAAGIVVGKMGAVAIDKQELINKV